MNTVLLIEESFSAQWCNKNCFTRHWWWSL